MIYDVVALNGQWTCMTLNHAKRGMVQVGSYLAWIQLNTYVKRIDVILYQEGCGVITVLRALTI